MSQKPVFAYAAPGPGTDLISLREALLALCGAVLSRGELHTLHHPGMTPLLCVGADQTGHGQNLRVFADGRDRDGARGSFLGRITWCPGGPGWISDLIGGEGRAAYRAGIFLGGDAQMSEVADAFRAGSPGAPTYFVGSAGGESARQLAAQQGLAPHLRQLLQEDLVYDAVFRHLLRA